MCAVIVLIPLILAGLGVQIFFYTTAPEDKMVKGAPFTAIGVGVWAAIAAYFACYYPQVTQIKVSKSYNTIWVTYKMMCMGRTIVCEESLTNIADMVVEPVRSQYGIVGYVANITFKNGAK